MRHFLQTKTLSDAYDKVITDGTIPEFLSYQGCDCN